MLYGGVNMYIEKSKQRCTLKRMERWKTQMRSTKHSGSDGSPEGDR